MRDNTAVVIRVFALEQSLVLLLSRRPVAGQVHFDDLTLLIFTVLVLRELAQVSDVLVVDTLDVELLVVHLLRTILPVLVNGMSDHALALDLGDALFRAVERFSVANTEQVGLILVALDDRFEHSLNHLVECSLHVPVAPAPNEVHRFSAAV